MTTPCPDRPHSAEDRIDGLLSAADAARYDRHIEGCAQCADAHAASAAMLERLYAPFAVEPAAPDLVARTREAFARRPGSPVGQILRYAASFAAGVLVTLALTAIAQEETAAHTPAESPVTAEPVDSPAATPSLPAPLARIR